MLNEEIRKFVKAQPFVPFDIELVTGRVLGVDHPDFVLVPPVRECRYFVFVDRRDGVPETFNSDLAVFVKPN